jgi:hypothetical protein
MTAMKSREQRISTSGLQAGAGDTRCSLPPHAEGSRVQLCFGEHLKLKGACGTRLTCVHGIAWVSVERDAGDILLRPGESFVVASAREVLVGPLRDTVTLDMQGVRHRRTAAGTHRRSQLGAMSALVGLKSRIRRGAT